MRSEPSVQQNPSISVVIPLYNHERFITTALESIYAQSIQPNEVIVVDDGSQDASLSVARKFASSHPESMVVRSHPNRGAHYTINTGIRQASGDVIAILNSDDAFDRNRFAECLPVFAADPGLAAVFTGISFMDEKGKPTQNPWYVQARDFYDRERDLSLALINGNFFMTTSNLIVRRSVFGEIGYFSALRYAHDLDFFLRLLRCHQKVLLHDKPLLAYRMHASNTISEDVLRVKVEWAAAVAFFLYSRLSDDDWNYYGRLTDITDRHTLTRLLIYFLAYYRSLPPGRLACDAFTGDESFLRFIHGAAK